MLGNSAVILWKVCLLGVICVMTACDASPDAAIGSTVTVRLPPPEAADPQPGFGSGIELPRRQ
jgi:hypothetical protein